jgi:hypothetical protein
VRGALPTWAVWTMWAASIVVGSCLPTQPFDRVTSSPACPRGAAPDPSERCACTNGLLLLLGACVEPSVGDAYCGAAARLTGAGCAFRACDDREALDVDGPCVPTGNVARSRPRCDIGSTLVVEGGRAICVPPFAACPRGTQVEGNGCALEAQCPAGALPATNFPAQDGAGATGARPACRSVVTYRSGVGRIVDLGAWTARILGPTGGAGSSELCGPLAVRPEAFGVRPGERLSVALSIRVFAPDQDLSRAYAEVTARGASGEALPPAGDDVARDSVRALVELLRSLGSGDGATGGGHGRSIRANATALETGVTCQVASL